MTKEIERLFDLNETDLFFDIGLSSSTDLEFLGKSKKQIIEAGKRWYSANQLKLKSAVCKESVLNTINKENNIELVAAVVDLIAGIVLDVSPITVATLIVKKGINNICKENDDLD